MPKLLSPELLQHYQQAQTTLTRCLRIERTNGKIVALTEHDHNLTIDDITYQSAVGYTPSAISMQQEGAVNTVDIEGILSVAGVTRADIAAGLFDQARIFVFEVNYEEVSQGILPLISGFWGECQLHDHHYVTEFNSLSQVLQQSVGELYSTHCRAQLGDKRCGIHLAAWMGEGVVATVKNNRQFTAAGFDQPAHYFQYGLITWQQGNNMGLSMEIQSFQRADKAENQAEPDNRGGTFQLVQPMPYAIEMGDMFQVTPGCDKSLTMCQNRFHNVVNFRGEPLIPGIDHMLKIP